MRVLQALRDIASQVAQLPPDVALRAAGEQQDRHRVEGVHGEVGQRRGPRQRRAQGEGRRQDEAGR